MHSRAQKPEELVNLTADSVFRPPGLAGLSRLITVDHRSFIIPGQDADVELEGHTHRC